MNKKSASILPCTAAAGLVGLALRFRLYRIGFDEKGLLTFSHPLHLLTLALAAAVILWLGLQTRKITGSADPRVNFPRTPLRTAGGLAAGILMLLHACSLARLSMSALGFARLALAALCAAAMLLAFCPPVRKSPVLPFCHGVICLHFALDMLCRYREWSGNPQLPDYCFHVLACVFLCLCSYQRLAFDVDQGSRKMLIFSCLTGLLLCMLSLVGPESMQFYLSGACWATCCMCTLTSPEAPAEVHAEPCADTPAPEEEET